MIKKPIRIHFKGPLHSCSGYGEHSRTIARSLKQMQDVEATFSSYTWGNMEDSIELSNVELSDFDPENVDVHIYHGLPDQFESHDTCVNIGITAGTEVSRIPYSWILGCQNVEAVFLSSTFAKEAFVNSSYKSQAGNLTFAVNPDKVHVIGECVDQDIFKPLDNPKSVIDDAVGDDFVFLNVSSWDGIRPGYNRKAVTELIDVTSRAFGSGNHGNVSLVLKTGSANPIERSENVEIVKKLKGKSANLNVHLVQGTLSSKQMSAMYNRADCYVTFTRGEAFGRGMLESLACQTPVIAPGSSGQTEFLSTDNSLLIGSDKVEVPVNQLKQDYPYPPGSVWFEPKQSDMFLSMVMVKNNLEVYVNKVKKWNKTHIDGFSIERFKEGLKEHIHEVIKTA